MGVEVVKSVQQHFAGDGLGLANLVECPHGDLVVVPTSLVLGLGGQLGGMQCSQESDALATQLDLTLEKVVSAVVAQLGFDLGFRFGLSHFGVVATKSGCLGFVGHRFSFRFELRLAAIW